MSVVQVTVAVVGFGLTFTLLMTGTTRYSYVHAQVPDCVSGLVTTTLTVPTACVPVVPVRVVSLSTLAALRVTPPIVAVAPAWKAVPVIVTRVPPAEGPFAGEIVVTVGAGAGSYVYVQAHVADCESGLITTTGFPVPGACAPVVPLSVVGPVTLTPVSATPPTVAVALDWKFVPLIVTGVPPDDGPFAGAIPVTIGGGRLGQFANLNVPTRVCQLKVPLVVRYSVVYQNVQSSTGSSASEL